MDFVKVHFSDFQLKLFHFHIFAFNLSLLLILQVGNLRQLYAIFLLFDSNSKSYFSNENEECELKSQNCVCFCILFCFWFL